MEFKIASAESLSDEGSKLSVPNLFLNYPHEDVVAKAVKTFRDIE